MREIIIGHVAPAYVGVALWVAEHEGILERPGVGVTNVILGTTEATTEALRDRSIDIAMTAPEGTIADAVAGGPLRVIAGSANKPPLSLIALPRHRRITDLRGGRIGTSSLKEGTRHLVEAMLAAEGLHWPRDYDFALEGNHLARWRALQHGSIDAALQLVPYNYLAEEAGFSHLGDADAYVPEFAFSAVCAHRAYLAGHAEAVSALLAALLAATRWFYANVEGAATIAASRTRLPQRHALRACQELAGKQVLPADLRVSPGALAAAVGALRATGQLPPPPSGQAGQAGQAGVAEAAAVGAAALDRTCLDQAATMV